MIEGQKLIENYWTAIYTGNPQRTNELVAEDFKGIAFSKAKNFTMEFNSRQELFNCVSRISGVIKKVIETKRSYTFTEGAIRVDFSYHIELTTNSELKSEGYQKWTTKIVDGKMLLDTVEIEE